MEKIAALVASGVIDLSSLLLKKLQSQGQDQFGSFSVTLSQKGKVFKKEGWEYIPVVMYVIP